MRGERKRSRKNTFEEAGWNFPNLMTNINLEKEKHIWTIHIPVSKFNTKLPNQDCVRLAYG
jgi:hypothetical protein